MEKQYYNYYNTSLNKLNKSLRNYLINPKAIYYPNLYEHIVLTIDLFRTNNYINSFRRLYALPWKIVFLKQELSIENNYPHTHGDTIFFPSSFFQLSTNERISLLIHEKIHVYQRYFPVPYHKILFNHFHLKVDRLLSTHPSFEKVRQNPDNNQLIYTDQGEYTLPLFTNHPTSIADVTFKTFNKHNKNTIYTALTSKNEHPNETFAYFLTNAVMKNNLRSLPPSIAKFM